MITTENSTLSKPSNPSSTSLLKRAFAAGAAVLIVTIVHHVYGAIHYGTPERYHAVVIAVVTLAVMLAGWGSHQRWEGRPAGTVGWWVLWVTIAAVPVFLFGVVEGLYNHLVKVALWSMGLPEETMRRFYPDSTYELPNNVLFEVTGVLHVIPAAAAALYLTRLIRFRRSAR